MRIALLSDTHGHLDEEILEALVGCDEVWHAGDVGSLELIDQLNQIIPARGVYGNIDDHVLRRVWPENLIFTIEGVKVFMTHIGGYPGRYSARVKEIIEREKPDLYICGHSHILKVMPDPKNALLHMNPGACGHHGFHHIRTILRFTVNQKRIADVEVVEFGRRGVLKK